MVSLGLPVSRPIPAAQQVTNVSVAGLKKSLGFRFLRFFKGLYVLKVFF